MALCAAAGGQEQPRSRGSVLEFTAAWCGACQRVSPIVSRLEREGLPIERIDVDQHPALAKRYAIRSIPTFVLVIDNEEAGRITGTTSENQLRALCARIPARPVADRPVTARGTAPEPVAQPAAGLPAGPLAASVRVRIRDSAGEDFGSGTIIHSLPGRSYILTCGHIFKHWDATSKILVDVFDGGRSQSFVGAKIACNLEDDVGLVAVNSDRSLPVARIAPAGTRVLKGTPLQGIGCSGGEQPTIEFLKVTALNRYQGAENIECTGVPAQGRSGGGLFTSDGVIVGVCMAADPRLQEGLYAGLQPIHSLLARCGLQEQISGQTLGNPAARDQTDPSPAGPIADHRLAAGPPLPRHRQPADAAPAPDESRATLARELQAALATAGNAELICLVRSRDGGPVSHQVVVVHRAGAELLDFLTGADDGNDSVLETSLHAAPSHGQASNRATPRAAQRPPAREVSRDASSKGAPAPYRRVRSGP